MKKIIIIIVLAVCSYTIKAQEKSFDKIVSFSLPKDIEKTDKENLESFINKRKNSQIDLKTNRGNLYKTGNILIQFNAGSVKIEKNADGSNRKLLQDQKRFYDDYATQISTQKNYSSVIKAINNYTVLITNYDNVESYSYFLLYGVNNSNDKTFTIRLEYKKEDETKASKIVELFLKNMRFK